MIYTSELSKSYGKKETHFQALSNINLFIDKGQTVAIVGKSGSGKSTLMHCLSGLDRADSGTITVNGQDIRQLKGKQLDQFRAKTIGFVFQSFFVQGHESCADNISLPLEAAGVAPKLRTQMIDRALADVDLADKKQVKAKNLSGGQKQRLAIARAIVNQPTIIFADEPTGNLDSQTGQSVTELLFGYNKTHQTTLIIVTHDQDLASKCQMQIYLKDGQIERIDGQTKQKGQPT